MNNHLRSRKANVYINKQQQCSSILLDMNLILALKNLYKNNTDCGRKL